MYANIIDRTKLHYQWFKVNFTEIKYITTERDESKTVHLLYVCDFYVFINLLCYTWYTHCINMTTAHASDVVADW